MRPIRILAVANVMDNDHPAVVKHFVYDPMIPNANSVVVSSVSQLSATLRPRIELQLIYAFDYPGDARPIDLVEVLNCRTLPVNLKGSHLASVIS